MKSEGSYLNNCNTTSFPTGISARSSFKNGFKTASILSGNNSERDSITGRNKRNKIRKGSNGSIKFSSRNMQKKRNGMDFTDFAYREAVTRLKFLLAESYTSVKPAIQYRKNFIDDSGDDTDNQSAISGKGIDRPVLSEISKYLSPSHRNGSIRNTLKKIRVYSPSPLLKENQYSPSLYGNEYIKPLVPAQPSVIIGNQGVAPPEILNFIEKQEDYIEQLEQESKFCRDELSNLLGKVKDVINENEALTEHARSDLANFGSKILNSSSDDTEDYYEKEKLSRKSSDKHHHQRPLSGPNIVFESRISELEAELTQAHIDIKKLRNENDELRRKATYGTTGDANVEVYRKQVENLQRDKTNLEDTIRKLQNTIDGLKFDGNSYKSQRNQDLAEMAIFEKSQADMEIKRLKEDLDRQHERVRELQHEMSRRISEERSNAERRYTYQVDALGGDLNCQWEQASKLQLELERQKRVENDLKRDLTQRNAQIEEMKLELKSKRSNHLTDIAQVSAEKQSLEQEITTLRLQLERAERQTKIETSRLSAEINSLRQRLDRADADVLHARRENLRLTDEIAALEKELALGEMKNEIRPTRADLNKSISELQDRHGQKVAYVNEFDFGNRFTTSKTAERRRPCLSSTLRTCCHSQPNCSTSRPLLVTRAPETSPFHHLPPSPSSPLLVSPKLRTFNTDLLSFNAQQNQWLKSMTMHTKRTPAASHILTDDQSVESCCPGISRTGSEGQNFLQADARSTAKIDDISTPITGASTSAAVEQTTFPTHPTRPSQQPLKLDINVKFVPRPSSSKPKIKKPRFEE